MTKSSGTILDGERRPGGQGAGTAPCTTGKGYRRRFLRLAIVVVAVLAGMLGYGFTMRAKRPPELTLYGNVDIRQVDLGFRVGGRLAQLTVDEGDHVTAGQVLGRLDDDPYERELREARAQAGSLKARWELLRAGYRSEDIAQARATLADRKATLEDTEKTFRRQEELRGTGAIAEHVYDDAIAARDEARERVRVAEQSLTELVRGYRREEVDEARSNHERAEATAAQAELRMADTILHAPADGVILTRAAEPGAILASGTTVFTVSLSHPVWARVFVNEKDLGSVVPGQAALIYTDGRRDRPYHGIVGYVSPTAEFTPKNVETPDLRTALVYRARVIVQDADGGLQQGMPVTVKLAEGVGAGPN
jgi:membrane fusion protein YbhG